MRCTTDDGVDITYDVTGDGPPVVLVHGLSDSRADWAPIVDRLSSDHRCIALDLRGHGESGDASDYGAIAMAADVAAVVTAEDLVAPLVIGHSLGGAVVSAYAATAPVAAVVNVDQGLRLSEFADALRPLEASLRGNEFHETFELVLDSMNGPMMDDDLRAELATHRRRARQDVVLGVWDLIFASTDDELDAVIDMIGSSVTVPYLSLHGLDPGPDYAEWLSARIPQAEVEHWADHGHYLHLVAPDRFCARVRDL